jgi:hypothetical protein
LGIVFLLASAGLSAWAVTDNSQAKTDTVFVESVFGAGDDSIADEIPAQEQPAPAPPPPPPAQPFLFGVGTELDQGLNHRITKEAPVKMLTSWYNGPNDLGFMNGWRTTKVPQAYASGYTLHLIIYSNDPEQNLNTAYGPACGRAYPVSPQFLNDMRTLSQNFAGGKLYVSMFTELQTYPCNDNTWAGSENYYKALQDNYMAAMDIFHKNAPGSQVSLTWGGWLANWDDPGKGGGKSLLKYFAGVLNASDFQSFQAMANHSNLSIITNMTKVLKPYPGGTMVAHYKPDGGSQAIFNGDIRDVFTSANMKQLQADELFAFSFMDTVNMNSSEAAYQAVKKVIQTYAK